MKCQLKSAGIIFTLAMCISLSGCATRRTGTEPPPPLKEPDPIQLVALPDYGAEKEEYDTSAGCLVLGSVDGNDNSIIQHVRTSLSGSLTSRGYSVIEFNNINTAEDRSRIDKIVRFQYYSVRSQHLPTKSQIATDIYLVVSVADVPDSVLSGPKNRRTFSVFARDFAETLDPKLAGLTTGKAIENATENLFCLAGFCQALEPKLKQQTVADGSL